MDNKKISFGFKSKLNNKPLLNLNTVKKKSEHELIECLEGQSIKIVGKVEEKPKLLIIPLHDDKNANKTKASMAQKIIREEQGLETPDEINDDLKNDIVPMNQNETLEQKAAREIINSLKEKDVGDATKVFTLPLKPDELPLEGAKESSLNDYDDIPVQDFGLAMLRGMGWKDDTGKKDASLKMPELRPKGMGLGADKVSKPKPLLIQPEKNEVLEIRKGSYVKILAGKQKGFYGQIEGFDDDSGRIIVKLAIGGGKESLNEFMLQVVSKQEWDTYAKVINSVKYEQYKNKETTNPTIKMEKIDKTENNPRYDQSSTSSKSRQNQRQRSPSQSSVESPDDKYTSHKSTQSSSTQKPDDEVKSMRSNKYDNYDRYDQSTSKSNKKYHKDRVRKYSTSSESSTSLSSPERRRDHHSKKSSSHSHKSKSRNRNRSRSRSYDRNRSRRYSSEDYEDDEDDKRHKKKTKKSKKPRSRSRTRR